jgi:hypothetical protein
MNAASDPTPVDPGAAAPTPLYTGPLMVPVDFTRLGPLPPPPTKENAAMVRVGMVVATLGSVALVLSLFIVPWFFVREISVVQPPAQGQGGGSSSSQTSLSSFAPRIVQRDIHDFGIVGWASSRREKRDIAIVALALLTQAAVLMGSMSYRWRLFFALAGCGALATLLVTLIDYQNIAGLIRERVALSNPAAATVVINASVLKIAGVRPGPGMIVLAASAGCVLIGAGVALMGGRRGKVLAPVQQ